MIASHLCSIRIDPSSNSLSFFFSPPLQLQYYQMIIKHHLSDLTHLINTFIRKQIILFFIPPLCWAQNPTSRDARSWWQDSDRCRVFISEGDRQEMTRRQVIGSHFSQKGKIISRFGSFPLPSGSLHLSWSFATQSCHRAEDETNERLENVKMFARPKIETTVISIMS